jgi:hypothetical protein
VATIDWALSMNGGTLQTVYYDSSWVFGCPRFTHLEFNTFEWGELSDDISFAVVVP